MLELSDGLGPLLVRQPVRIHVQIVSDERIEVAHRVGFRAAVGQLYNFFISASFVSARASRTGTAEKK